MVAASTSLRGALPPRGRYPRRWSDSPELSRERWQVSWYMCMCICRSGYSVSTEGRLPVALRMLSAMASFTLRAA